VFDIGWQELFIVGLVAIIVVGPRELPRVLRTVTLGIRKVRGMARDFQDGIEELAREADIADMRKEIEDASNADFKSEINSIADPARELETSVREASETVNAPEPAPKIESTPEAATTPKHAEPASDKKAGDGA
jgi:sec-independent protein translocase protein TatB